MKIKILHLFPDLLNMYGDRGNIEVLRRRLEWRGIEVEVAEHTADMGEIDISDTDIIYLGGGGDAEEKLVAAKLLENSEKLTEYAEANKTIIAVCGGFPLLGRYYKDGDTTIYGAGVLDVYTEPADKHFIGDTVLNSRLIKSTVVGFINHSGRTYINGNQPIGEVIEGFGNNGEDGMEGAVYKNVYATYLHGPLFPKNPKLADFILEQTLREKYIKFLHLEPLEDNLETKAHIFMAERNRK